MEGDLPPCPVCGGKLLYRDNRPRIRKKEGGMKERLIVSRYRCQNKSCRRLHTGLPDCLVPHKHYEAEVISGVYDGIVTEDDMDSEQYPCAATMSRWIRWLIENICNIEGHFRRMAETDSRFKGLTFQGVHSKTQRWLEDILSFVYNTGGALPPWWKVCT